MFAYFVLHGFPLVFDQAFITACRRKIALSILLNDATNEESVLSFVNEEGLSDTNEYQEEFNFDDLEDDHLDSTEDRDSAYDYHTDREWSELLTPKKSPSLVRRCPDEIVEAQLNAQVSSGKSVRIVPTLLPVHPSLRAIPTTPFQVTATIVF